YQQSRIAQEHAAEQRRLSVEVPMPSSGLAAMLQLAPQAQLQHLVDRPELRKELTQLSHMLERRLAPQERKALHDDDFDTAQKSLGVSMEQATQISH
ncbi:adenosine monophosphate-protein transferase, partial [Brucella intermedia]